jgi:hypothetical protein
MKLTDKISYGLAYGLTWQWIVKLDEKNVDQLLRLSNPDDSRWVRKPDP